MMRKHSHIIAFVLFLALLLPVCFVPVAHAISDEERETLEMFFDEQDRVVTVTRTPKPISQVAENISVITAKEIEALNAHTIAEVLNTITGVNVEMRNGLGGWDSLNIQGADFTRVRVLIDGITLNNLVLQSAELNSIPIQNIDRIEVIKGPASSMWGSALGGVINIVTKEPAEKEFQGTVSASIGERTTGDFREEMTGSVNKFGYYEYVGGVTTDGFQPDSSYNALFAYSKMKWKTTTDGRLGLTLGYDKLHFSEGVIPEFASTSRDRFRHILSSISYAQAISGDVDFEIRGNLRKFDVDLDRSMIGFENNKIKVRELSYGITSSLTWREGINLLTVGAEYDHGKLRYHDNQPEFTLSPDIDSYGVFVNDSLLLGDFTLTPGVRFDLFSSYGDYYSPSFGATYNLTAKTILRATIAKGFSLPINFLDGVKTLDKVFSYQAGFESSDLKCLWMKATYFNHYVKFRDLTKQNVKVTNQGVEFEAKTVPLYNTSISVGYVFTDSRDEVTGEIVKFIPRYSYNVGVNYNDKDTFNALLRVRNVRWNYDEFYQGKYNAFIFDLSMTKKVYESDARKVDLFFNVNNLFNGSMYPIGFFKNAPRWFEGGIRFKF